METIYMLFRFCTRKIKIRLYATYRLHSNWYWFPTHFAIKLESPKLL